MRGMFSIPSLVCVLVVADSVLRERKSQRARAILNFDVL